MSEWRTVTFKDIAEFNPRESIKKGEIATKVAMDKLQPFCRDIPEVEHEAFSGGTKFRNGDTIMARITPCLENGKTAMVNVLDEDEVGFGSTEYIVLRAKEGVTDPYFLYYLVCSPTVREPAIKSMVGSSGRQRVQTDVVQNLEFEIPAYDEQIIIGDFLKKLDDKISVNNQINRNLSEQAQALFQDRFVDNEPEGEQIPLYEFAEYINGTSFKKDEYTTEGVPIIKIAELKNGITDSTQYFAGQKDKKYDVDNGDILFSWSGNPDTSIDIFIWSNGHGILNQHTFNVKWLNGNKWFTYLMLKSFKTEFAAIASNKQTTGLGHVTVADLKRLTFVFAKEAMKNFEDEVAPLMERIYSNMIENTRLVALRDTLLPKLMSGEIDVSDLDI